MFIFFFFNFSFNTQAKADDASGFEPWEVRRQGILARYTTNQKLSITFTTNKGAQVKENATSMTDKVGN